MLGTFEEIAMASMEDASVAFVPLTNSLISSAITAKAPSGLFATVAVSMMTLTLKSTMTPASPRNRALIDNLRRRRLAAADTPVMTISEGLASAIFAATAWMNTVRSGPLKSAREIPRNVSVTGTVRTFTNARVGILVGTLCSVGLSVGSSVGYMVGSIVGREVGVLVGNGVGMPVGSDVGIPVGTGVGTGVGCGVGASEQSMRSSNFPSTP
jgi:hypothetical protein